MSSSGCRMAGAGPAILAAGLAVLGAAASADPPAGAPAPPPEDRLERLERDQRELREQLLEKDARLRDLEIRLERVGRAEPTAPRPDGLADRPGLMPDRDSLRADQASAPRAGNAPLDPTYAGFTPLAGTRTWIKLGGYVKVDAISDTRYVGNPNEFITAAIPVSGEPDHGRGARFALHAKQTRLNLEARRATPLGALRTFYENDFFGDSAGRSMSYRLRHCYGQVANLTIGQTWTAFMDPDAIPDTLDVQGPNGLSLLRQTQVRYTVGWAQDALHTAVAFEAPDTGILGESNGVDGVSRLPDLIVQGRWSLPRGHLQASGLLREIGYDDAQNEAHRCLGWGAGLTAVQSLAGEDHVQLGLNVGEGIGRYIQDLSGADALVEPDGSLAALAAWGGFAACRHTWAPGWRSTVSFGVVDLEGHDALPDTAFDRTVYGSGNLVWSPTPACRLGAEYLYGCKRAQNGESGDDHRVQVSLQYNFIL